MKVSREQKISASIAIIVLLFVTGANATTYKVSSDLQSAINKAAPGDALMVSPGTYDRIEITKSLSLIGDGATIRAGATDACISVKADSVNITGFTVTAGLYGIYLDNVSNCYIFNNTAIYCKQPGIALLSSNDNIIAYNNASFNGIVGEGWYGIYLSSSNDNQIIGNIASDNGAYGIFLFPFCQNNIIRDNILDRNMYGIDVKKECTGNVIESNRMCDNINSGLSMSLSCHDNRILNNTISRNAVSGISLMMDSGNNSIKGNDISDNGHFGIQIMDASGNTIAKNSIYANKKGIYVESDGNHIYNNRLYDNVLQVEDRGTNMWYSLSEGGNFWGDYVGDDADGDGFGDTPYKINEESMDYYPLMGDGETYFSLIEIAKKSIMPARASIGQQVSILVEIEAAYDLSYVTVHAVSIEDMSSTRPISMEDKGGGLYEGTLVTSLMDPGRYELVLTTKDKIGNNFEESIGEVELLPGESLELSPITS